MIYNMPCFQPLLKQSANLKSLTVRKKILHKLTRIFIFSKVAVTFMKREQKFPYDTGRFLQSISYFTQDELVSALANYLQQTLSKMKCKKIIITVA
jgi:hypothetical protein